MKNVIAKGIITAIAASVIITTPTCAKASVTAKADENTVSDNPADNLHYEYGSGYVAPKEVKPAKNSTKAPAKAKSRRKVRRAPSVTVNWDDYSSSYFKDKLSGDKLTFYNNLCAAAKSFMDSTETASSIPVSCKNLSIADAKTIFQIWKETEAQYFFVANEIDSWPVNDTMNIYIMKDYQEGSNRQKARNTFLNTIDTLTSKAESASSVIQKEKIIHDELVKRLIYDMTDDGNKQSSSSSLIGNSTVCAGYAAAFSVLMNKLGVDTISITSTGHEWNEIKINGNWYNLDVTHDDPSKVTNQYGQVLSTSSDPDGININYSHFNIKDADLKSLDGNHTPESYWDEYNRPVCNEDFKTLSTTSSYLDFNELISKITYGDRLSDKYLTTDVTRNFPVSYNGNQVNGSWHFNYTINGRKIDSSIVNKKYLKLIFVPSENADDYYPLTASTLISSISPRPITIKIDSLAKNAGDKNPELTWNVADGTSLGYGDKMKDVGINLSCNADENSTAGSYPIKYVSCSNNNYTVNANDDAVLTVSGTILKTPSITEDPSIDLTYGKTLDNATLTGGKATTDGTFKISDSVDKTTVLKPGKHTVNVTFTPSDQTQYKTVSRDITFTVKKKPINITIDDKTITEGDTPKYSFSVKDSDLVNPADRSSIKVTYTLDGNASDPGTHAINATAESDLYEITVKPGKLTVNEKKKVDPIFKSSPALSLTYGDRLNAAKISGLPEYDGNAVKGTFTFEASVDTAKIRPAGSYEYNAVFTPEDAKTYNSATAAVKVTVAKRRVAITIDNKSKDEDTSDPKLTYRITSGSFLDSDNADDIISLQREPGEDSGKTYPITAALSNDSNYDITVTDGTFKINKVIKAVKIAAVPSMSGTYGDRLSEFTIAGGAVTDEDGNPVSGKWTLSTKDRTVNKSNADSEVSLLFTPSDASSYKTATARITPSIAKRKITVKADDITRIVGEKKALTFTITSGSLVSGDTDSDLAVILTSSNMSDTAGDYTISGNSASQYYDVTVELGTLTIKSKEKVTPAISTKPSIKITYGEKISNDKITKGAARDGSRTVKGTFTIAENVDTDKLLTAGTHTVKAVFTPDDKSAYNTVETEITVTVAKKHISITIDDKTKTEDEADPTFTKKVTGDFVGNDNIDDFLTISRRAGEAAGKYAITGTVKNADNYDIAVNNGTLTINAKPEEKPAETTVQTAPVLTVTYGDRLSSASITNGSVISDGNAVTGTWKITTSDRTVNKSNASRKVTLTFTPSDTKKYSSVSVDVTPTVEKRKITVKADDITRTVGESKSLTYKITNGSLASGDTESDLKVTLRSSNTSDTAGTYVISGTADVDYYDVTVQNGTLTINAKSSDSGSTSGGSTSGGQTGGNSGNTSDGSGSSSGSSSSDNPSNPSGTTVTTYSIAYDLNGGTATGNPSSYRNDSNPITLTTPARTGYTFTGWTGSNGSTPQTTVTIRKGTTGNLYFIANWQDNNSANNSTTADTGTYKISYNLNGGTVNRSNPVSYTARDTYLINNPWREGYFFAGWTSNLSNIPQMVVTIPRGTTGDITFTATWTLDTSNHATAGNDDNTDVNTQTDDDGWTEWINGDDDSDIPDIPSTSITKTTSNKKSVTIKFRRASVSGYTVKYQAAIKKANAGRWKKSFVSKTSKTFKGLKKKTTYWVSVRPYTTVDGTRYFGDWAKTKVRKTR